LDLTFFSPSSLLLLWIPARVSGDHHFINPTQFLFIGVYLAIIR
jgi:hypothetical protein